MSQGVTGHAGNQLPRARDPRPTDFFPLHGGVGLDFTENIKSRGKVGDPVFHLNHGVRKLRPEILVSSLFQLMTAIGPLIRSFSLAG